MRVLKQYPYHFWHKLYHALRGWRFIACSYCCIPISYHTFLPKEGNLFSKVAIFVSLFVSPQFELSKQLTTLYARWQNCEERLLASSCLYICLSLCLSLCLYVCLSVCPCVRPSVRPSTYTVWQLYNATDFILTKIEVPSMMQCMPSMCTNFICNLATPQRPTLSTTGNTAPCCAGSERTWSQ
jgi:hypothetical protein